MLRNLLEGRFEGVVYPVNPGRESVHGIQAYAGVADTPAPPDLAVVCTPAKVRSDVVRYCGEAGVRGVAVLSAGFREAGEEGRSSSGGSPRRPRVSTACGILGPQPASG